jgi:hypothetical protein
LQLDGQTVVTTDPIEELVHQRKDNRLPASWLQRVP